MKAYFFTESQIAQIIEYGINSWNNNSYIGGYGRITMVELAQKIVEECHFEDIQKPTPILLNDVSEITQHCTFYPKEDIVGFTGKDGFLSGVFIKEK